jgi:YD repeat-containing protein
LATAENGWLYTYLSKGDGKFEQAPFNFPNANFEANYVWAVDYNGDGKTDLASRENGYLYTYFSRGDGQYDKVAFDFVSSQFTASRVWPADYKGHGKSDWASTDSGILYTYISNGAYPDLLVKITNPFQGQNEITYKPLTDGSVYHKEDSQYPQYLGRYPNIDVQLPIYVVSHLRLSDVDNTYDYSYAYHGAKLNLHGRGWLGYRIMQVTDSSAGAINRTFYYQYFPKTGLPHIQETEQIGGGMLLDVEYRYCDGTVPDDGTVSNPPCLELPTGVKQVLLKRVETAELEGQEPGRVTAKTFRHDDWGNLTFTNNEGVVGAQGDETEEETQWAMNLENWLFRPKTIILRDGSGATTLRRQKWLFYDGNNNSLGALGDFGLPTKEEIRRDSQTDSDMGSWKNSVYIYTYDPVGNRATVTDPRGCTTKTTYEQIHKTYPASVIKCDNLQSPKFTTTYDYYAEHGGIHWQTDEDNHATTTFLYDGFGRPMKVTNQIDAEQSSFNGTESYSYPAWGTPDAQHVLISKTKDHGSAVVINTEHHFDGFGRVDFTSRDGPDGSPILTQTVYDSRGLVRFKSIPRFESEAAKWEEIRYDARGRETQIIHPDGTYVTKVYTPGQVTITDERGKIKIHSLDAYGRLAQVKEKNGSENYFTSYTYDGAGALTSTTNALQHSTTIAYDLAGRKTFMRDPNMGDWSYTYTNAGDLESQTDAKQQTLCFEYDPLGRPSFSQVSLGERTPWKPGRNTKLATSIMMARRTWRIPPLGESTYISRQAPVLRPRRHGERFPRSAEPTS